MNTYTLKNIIVFIIICQIPLAAQSSFKAGVAVGLNFSQINGDNHNGYNKIGASLGIKGGFNLTHNMDICTELFYNNTGSKPSRDDLTLDAKFKYMPTVDLQKADMLIIFNVYHKLMPSNEFYKIGLQVGFSYGRLLRSKTEITQYLNPVPKIAEYLNKNYKYSDFGFVFGCSYLFTPRFGASLRHTFSLNKLYRKPDSTLKVEEVGDFTSFQPYYISCHFFYNFIQPQFKAKDKVGGKKKEINPLERL
jgi:Outer membrane protein beta-barrel domain